MKYRTKIRIANLAFVLFAAAALCFVVHMYSQRRTSSDSNLSEIASHRRTSRVANEINPLQSIDMSQYKSVTKINDLMLSELQKSHEHFMVYFYMPWCDHCLEYLEEYNKVAESLSHEIHYRNKKLASRDIRYEEILFAHINCEDHWEACRSVDYQLQSFPTIIAFNFKYTDTLRKSSVWASIRQEVIPVSVDRIKRYVNQHHFTLLGSPFFYERNTLVTELSDLELLSVIQGAAQRMVVAFYVPWCPHCKEFVARFTEIAKDFGRDWDRVRSTAGRSADDGVVFAAINCDHFRETCFGNDLPVSYYPTVIAFNMNRDMPVEQVDTALLQRYLTDRVLGGTEGSTTTTAAKGLNLSGEWKRRDLTGTMQE